MNPQNNADPLPTDESEIADPAGLLQGVDQPSGAPIFYDLWGGATTPGGHTVVYGTPGRGYTVSLEALCYRNLPPSLPNSPAEGETDESVQ